MNKLFFVVSTYYMISVALQRIFYKKREFFINIKKGVKFEFFTPLIFIFTYYCFISLDIFL